ncbi:hypothetical protein MTP99_011271 [Tenebrio molitor]|nr:hypothetical protein MTP99_011271 [Tenebrio molitor]
MAVTIYREIRADSPTHYRFNISEFPGDSVGDRRAGGCAASRELRITCVAFGIRNHPRERIADAMVLIVRRCQASGPSKSPKIYRTDYRFTALPISRDPSSSSEIEGYFEPVYPERNSSSQITVPYREGVPESPPSKFIVEHPLSAERSRSWSSITVLPVPYRRSLMVHFVRTRQDHAVMPRLMSQA